MTAASRQPRASRSTFQTLRVAHRGSYATAPPPVRQHLSSRDRAGRCVQSPTPRRHSGRRRHPVANTASSLAYQNAEADHVAPRSPAPRPAGAPVSAGLSGPVIAKTASMRRARCRRMPPSNGHQRAVMTGQRRCMRRVRHLWPLSISLAPVMRRQSLSVRWRYRAAPGDGSPPQGVPPASVDNR